MSEPTMAALPGVVSRECSDILIKIATTRHERAGAFGLAYQSYLQAGLCGPSAAAMRITPHQLHPCTDVFVALLRGEVISTLSLVRDGELGLPLEAVYPDEVRARRAAGIRLGEVSCLADRRREPARFFGLFSDLARLMTQTAERDGIDQLLIAVHPRHARMYRRAMGFEQVGEYREYEAVNGNPAVALCLDLKFVREQRPEIWGRFVGEPLPAAVLRPCPMPVADVGYFSNLVGAPTQARFRGDAPALASCG
ncbi:MAG: hypothetical protein KDA44_22775 [Planctomycetales bacterium]|nr:hypothetical protein [Planctomycetales bacterium]